MVIVATRPCTPTTPRDDRLRARRARSRRPRARPTSSIWRSRSIELLAVAHEVARRHLGLVEDLLERRALRPVRRAVAANPGSSSRHSWTWCASSARADLPPESVQPLVAGRRAPRVGSVAATAACARAPRTPPSRPAPRPPPASGRRARPGQRLPHQEIALAVDPRQPPPLVGELPAVDVPELREDARAPGRTAGPGSRCARVIRRSTPAICCSSLSRPLGPPLVRAPVGARVTRMGARRGRSSAAASRSTLGVGRRTGDRGCGGRTCERTSAVAATSRR